MTVPFELPGIILQMFNFSSSDYQEGFIMSSEFEMTHFICI